MDFLKVSANILLESFDLTTVFEAYIKASPKAFNQFLRFVVIYLCDK